MSKERIVITGMSIITPIGDELTAFYNNLLHGKSAITRWKTFITDNIYAKVGGDLYDYPVVEKLKELQNLIPEPIYKKACQLIKGSPWGEKLTIIAALKLYIDAKMNNWPYEPHHCATIVPGHNLNPNYEFANRDEFRNEPDFIDGLYALRALDTNHAGVTSELLNLRGSTYTVGAACASGNAGLKLAIDEIKYHDMEAVIIMAPVLDFSPLEFQGLSLMDAIAYKSFNNDPEKASRPYDTKREGFVPSHGAAALMVEKLSSAKARGATIYAEVCSVESSADANHLPQPSTEGQAYLIKKVLNKAQIHPEQIDYISAHATSTLLGDITEIRAIKDAIGKHASNLKINAPKSILGHTCWSSATVETVAALLQMKYGKLHPSINIDNLDPEIDLDVCRNAIVEHNIQYLLKNSFGFGGLNCISVFKRYEE